MAFEPQRVRQCLQDFAFERLFVEELGWDRHTEQLPVSVDDHEFTLSGVAEKKGFVVLLCAPLPDGQVPDRKIQLKIHRNVARVHYQHMIIYADAKRTRQVWQWVRREPGKPIAPRYHTYYACQSGEPLVQKLQRMSFSLEEEEGLTHAGPAGRVRAAMDVVGRITKRFYEHFKTEHARFLRFIKGIPDKGDERWYASVMLNRLMFVYFIQQKRFLNDDPDYLKTKLAESKKRGKDRYYREFLTPLFFEGFAKRRHSAAMKKLLGDVPYLNGGIFLPHEIEERYGKKIKIPDSAFEKLFAFFRQYTWHLDERPLRDDREINPDVLGYIFEKYINQKELGAYYTKEDITGYISRNTVIPYLFDVARRKCKIAFEGEQSVWRLLQADPDRYIYDAVKHGITVDALAEPPKPLESPLELPPEIAAGVSEVSKRTQWNAAAPAEYALPTEIWREVAARRRRYEEVRGRLAAGEVRDVNDLITLNLDIEKFAQDVIGTADSDLVSAFWHAIENITVLDPACGSGAFLFAALNILEELYEGCIDRMEEFVAELDRPGVRHHPARYSTFRKVLERMAQHPNRKYFIFKSIIISNLYGVDIVEEAVEICKLRLFLKLVAQVERDDSKPNMGIEPLPDIDFNVRAGNTLVGFASREAVREALETEAGGQSRLVSPDQEAEVEHIEEQAEIADRAFQKFREMQVEHDMDSREFTRAKDTLLTRLKKLEDELNHHLAAEYAVDVKKKGAYEKWLKTHKPFHWFVDFYGIMKNGGFDVVIGNPPYVETRNLHGYKPRGYACWDSGNTYALFMERSLGARLDSGRLGFIVPVSSVSADRYSSLQRLLGKYRLHYSSFDDRPSRLFEGLQHCRLTIHLMGHLGQGAQQHSTRYSKWCAGERPALFQTLVFAPSIERLVEGSLPKLTSPIELGIIRKLASQKTRLSSHYSKGPQHRVLYSRKVGYFLQALDFEPHVLDGQGQRRPPSEFKELPFASPSYATAALCCLNASLFYWFITVFSDCRHLNKRELNAFPADLAQMASGPGQATFAGLAQRLMADLRERSEERTMRFAHDTLKVQCIIPKHSKERIDEIDRVLARHYGFTDEELDFIINYDIKYRMGLAAGGGGQEKDEEAD